MWNDTNTPTRNDLLLMVTRARSARERFTTTALLRLVSRLGSADRTVWAGTPKVNQSPAR